MSHTYPLEQESWFSYLSINQQRLMRQALFLVEREYRIPAGEVIVDYGYLVFSAAKVLDQTGLVDLSQVNHKIYKFLLTCPPEIAAHRVLQRQMTVGEIPQHATDTPEYDALVRKTTDNLIARHLKDWKRFEIIYGIHRSNIYKGDIIQIPTSDKSQPEVVEAILQHLT